MFQLIVLVGLSQYAGATSDMFFMVLALVLCSLVASSILVAAMEDFDATEKECEDAAKEQADLELKQSEVLEQVKTMNVQLDKSIAEINERNAKKVVK